MAVAIGFARAVGACLTKFAAVVVLTFPIAIVPAGAQTFSASSWSGPSPTGALGGQCLTGDFNGDGLTDVACDGSGTDLSVALSSGSSFTTQTWTGGVTASNPVGDYCLTGDFSGDGRTDIACYSGSGSSWQIGLSSGSGFTAQSWGTGVAVTAPIGERCIAGDFSGDARADIACYTGNNGNWALWISSGTNFASSIWSSGVSPANPVNRQCMPGDFNRDGRMDIACYSGSGGAWAVALSQGSSFASQVWSSSLAPGNPLGSQCVSGEFNGDGSTDLLCYTGSNGTWAVGLSTGSVFATQFWSSGVAPTGPVNEQCSTGDFNGDGLTDLSCYSGSNGDWKIGMSTGRGFASQIWTSSLTPAFPIGDRCLTSELNGDGLADIFCKSTTGDTWSIGRASPGAM
jgi:hypothetical protein